MRYLLFICSFTFLCITSQGQSVETMNDYASEWKTIDSLEQQGLPQSALEQVELIYQKIKVENNLPQLIKALIYRHKFQIELEEDGLANAITKMEAEIEETAFPAKAILQSMLGEMYSFYMQRNRWTIQNRTSTVEQQSNDIKVWTVDQLMEESNRLYWLSINREQELQQICYPAICRNPE